MSEQTLIPKLQAAFKLASMPVDSPMWRSSGGEEYLYHATDQYVIVNEKIWRQRERIVAMIIGSVIVE